MANNITLNTVWDMDVGGLSSDDDVNAVGKTTVGKAIAPKGIFAAFPGMTPKYATNIGEIETDFRETMARMFLQVTDYKTFVNSFTGSDTLPVATVLGGQASEQDGTTGGKGYIDFLLQSAQHNFNEKSQVLETLADDHVAYFFGQAAPTFSYGGSLVNTKQDDQAINMLRLYSEIGRGSKLAARNTLISMRYDSLIVSGAMMNLGLNLGADNETVVPFSFNLLVKRIQILKSPKAGVVTLTKPFSNPSDGYKPFSTGAANVNTAIVRPTMTPSDSTVPAASAATEPVSQSTEDPAYVIKMSNTTLAQSTPSSSSAAAQRGVGGGL